MILIFDFWLKARLGLSPGDCKLSFLCKATTIQRHGVTFFAQKPLRRRLRFDPSVPSSTHQALNSMSPTQQSYELSTRVYEAVDTTHKCGERDLPPKRR